MRFNRRISLLIGIAALAFFLLSCGLLAAPTQDTDPIYTQAAQTIAARETAAALETLNTRPSPIPAPSATPSAPPVELPTLAPSASPPPPPTPTPQPSPSPTPAMRLTDTPTPVVPQSVACDAAVLQGDISIPPDTQLLPGARFNKIWRIQNTGSCTWSPAYALVYDSGDPLSSYSTVFLPAPVAPGANVDLSVPMTAPYSPGIYQSSWVFRNASGGEFGFGAANQPVIARIRVSQPSVPVAYSLNFSADFCSAAWRSSVSFLPCPGTGRDSQGSVVLLDRPALESQATIEYGLWTRPAVARNGLIIGKYPATTVIQDDHFLAELDCLQGSSGCDVFFQLDYQILNGPSGTLGRWREQVNGSSTQVDIDLAPLVGRQVQFSLLTANNGDLQAANGVWLMPRIQNLRQSPELVLSWTQEGKPKATSCVQLQIYLTSRDGAQARASTCGETSQEIGVGSLSNSEYSRLIGWVQQLSTFNGQIYSNTSERAVTSFIEVRGSGGNGATDADIQTISNFAAAIFNRIAGN